MKKSINLICLFIIFWGITSCGKETIEQATKETPEQILAQKIQDIIEEKFLDSLKKWGLPIHMGTTPPLINGTYSVTPHVLHYSSNPKETPGALFLDALVQVNNQNGKDLSLDLYGINFLSNKDTSVTTVISGEGKKFTIYGSIKSTHLKINKATFAIVISGEKESNHIKNLKYGIINIDGSQDIEKVFIAEGQGRINKDKDAVSEKIRDSLFGKMLVR